MCDRCHRDSFLLESFQAFGSKRSRAIDAVDINTVARRSDMEVPVPRLLRKLAYNKALSAETPEVEDLLCKHTMRT